MTNKPRSIYLRTDEFTAAVVKDITRWASEFPDEDWAGSLTCSEADALAAFLRATGVTSGRESQHEAAAKLLIIAHGRTDEPDDAHYAGNLLRQVMRGADLDTESSASRQHYIETGEHLRRGEAEEA